MEIIKIYCSFNGNCKERGFISLEDAATLLEIDRLTLVYLISDNKLVSIFTEKSTKIEFNSLKKYASTKGIDINNKN